MLAIFFQKPIFGVFFEQLTKKNQTSLTKILNFIYVARVKLGHQNTHCL
jgi:hypothetical protein